MEYAIIAVISILVIAAGTVIFLKLRKIAVAEDTQFSENDQKMLIAQSLPEDNCFQELVVQLEMLPAEAIPDENKLVEIRNSRVLAQINNLVPELAQVDHDANNIVQAIQDSGEILYRAIIPAGAKLSNSHAMEDAVRGIYHGADGISGHANLIAVEAQKGGTVATNAVSAALGVASMVVGQYYMNQINIGLNKIGDGVSKIVDFQDNEYQSRVFSLVTHVKRIADFQVEILENDELRITKISQLGGLEEECTKLLGQADLTITASTQKENLDYTTYEKELHSVQNWYVYQKTLIKILHKISELRYTLHLGAVSREHCIALLPGYTKQVAKTQKHLVEWHQSNTQRLKIDTSEVRRKRDGFDRAIHFLPGLLKDDLNFRDIKTSTAKMIKA